MSSCIVGLIINLTDLITLLIYPSFFATDLSDTEELVFFSFIFIRFFQARFFVQIRIVSGIMQVRIGLLLRPCPFLSNIERLLHCFFATYLSDIEELVFFFFFIRNFSRKNLHAETDSDRLHANKDWTVCSPLSLFCQTLNSCHRHCLLHRSYHMASCTLNATKLLIP